MSSICESTVSNEVHRMGNMAKFAKYFANGYGNSSAEKGVWCCTNRQHNLTFIDILYPHIVYKHCWLTTRLFVFWYRLLQKWFAFTFQLSLSEGCRLPVRMNGTDDWPLAEIISIRETQGHLVFYVHYVDCEWTSSWNASTHMPILMTHFLHFS